MTPMKTVAKAMTLLKLFSAARPEWALAEIARESGINKVIAHRLLRTLAESDMVVQHAATRRYRLGPAVVELAGHLLARFRPLEAARPHLLKLWEDSRETVHLVVQRQHEVAALFVLESPQPMRVAANVGERAPIHCTPSGKIFLAFGDASVRAARLAQPLKRLTVATIVSRPALERELIDIRRRGFAFDMEESAEHVRAVAAAIFDESATVVAAIALLGPSVRMTRPRLARLGKQVKTVADRVSRELGFDQAVAGGKSS